MARSAAHVCNHPACSKPAPAGVWGCSLHWDPLPDYQRAHLVASWQPSGEYRSQRARRDYVTSVKRAVAWLEQYGPEECRPIQGSML